MKNLSICVVLFVACAPFIGAQAQTSIGGQSGHPAAVSDIDRSVKSRDQENKVGGRSSRSYYNLGVRYALAGQSEEAVKAFQQAIQLNPNDSDAYFSLGNVYSDLGRWNEAVRVYHDALRLDQRDGEAYNNLGVAYIKLGQYGRAVEAFEHAIRIHPKWAEPHYNLGTAFYKMGRHEAATAAYKQAIRLRPDYGARVLATSAQAQTSPAAPANVKAAVKKTNDAPLRASATRERARSQPRDAKAYYNLGVKHGLSKRFEESAEAFREAIRLKQDYADAYFGLGHAYYDLGRWRESIKAYEQAVRLNPKDKEAYEMLGKAYARLQASADSQSIGELAVGEKTVVTIPSVASSSSPAAPTTDTTAASVTNSPLLKRNDSHGARPNPAKGETESGTVSSKEAAAKDPTSFYRIGAGDVLDIRLLSRPVEQPNRFTVTAGGLLEHPLLGEPLAVAGLTTDEVRAHLASELKRRAVDDDPKVSVGVSEYASHTIIVSGLVNDPGTKVLRREAVPLYVVVADAQPSARAGSALIVSHSTGLSTTVDLSDPEAMNVLVYPGDVVTVQERPQQFFYIGGDVKDPGEKSFHPGITLTQAVLAAGGASRSSVELVEVARQGADGLLRMSRYNLKDIESGKLPDPRVKAGDRIKVGR